MPKINRYLAILWLGDRSFGILKLGELGEISFEMLKLGGISFGMLKLGELGEVSFGMLKLG